MPEAAEGKHQALLQGLDDQPVVGRERALQDDRVVMADPDNEAISRFSPEWGQGSDQLHREVLVVHSESLPEYRPKLRGACDGRKSAIPYRFNG